MVQVVYKLIPGFDDEALLIVSRYTTKLRAVVLELYGTGNSPSRRKEFLHFIQVGTSRLLLIVDSSGWLRAFACLLACLLAYFLEDEDQA